MALNPVIAAMNQDPAIAAMNQVGPLNSANQMVKGLQLNAAEIAQMRGIGNPTLLNSAQRYIIPRGYGNSVPNVIVFTPQNNSTPWAKQYDWLVGILAPYNPSIAIAILGKHAVSGKVDSWIQQPTGGAVLNANALTQAITGMKIYTIKPNAAPWLKAYEWVIGAPITDGSPTVLAIWGSLRGSHKFVDWTKRADNGARIPGNTLYGF